MKKLLYLLICLLCIGVQTFAGQIMRGSGGVAEGVVGYSGSTNTTATYNNGYFMEGYYQASASGTVGYGHILFDNNGTSRTVCISLHNSSGTKILSAEKTFSHSGTAWVNAQMPSTDTITSGNYYYINIQFSIGTSPSGWRYNNASGQGYYQSQSYNCGASMSSVPGNDDGTRNYGAVFNNSSGDPS